MASIKTFVALAAIGVAAAGCARPEVVAKHNPTLYSVHQPVVQRSDYMLDLTTGPDGLSAVEQARLDGWFGALRLGYGDRISIDGADYGAADVREDVARVAASYGMLVSDGAPVTTGAVPPGSARVIVSRATASVPGCPDWAYAELTGAPISTDSNYGCATNQNLAAMIADPNDLISGRTGDGSSDAAAAVKSIKAYRDRAGSGASGGVQATGVGN